MIDTERPSESSPPFAAAVAAALAAVLSATVLLLAPRPAGAAEIDRFTPVVAEAVAPAEPVVAADGRKHLAYELLLVNSSLNTATVQRITAFAGKRSLGALEGDRLAAVMKPMGSDKPGVVLGPGGSAYVLMDLSFNRRAKLPKRFTHRIDLNLQPDPGVVATSYRTGPTRVVRRPAVVVAPPLRGNGWIVGNGCCEAFTSHRAAMLGINGGFHTSERFAIDFIQIDPMGKLLTGPFDQLSSYPFFGDPVLSATRGRVVDVKDGLPETQPAGPLPPVTAEKAGGNFVVVRMSRDRYAFYAHLQPGSITVEPGDTVRVGQRIGSLGSTGNSNAPHLHFHVMDGPLPLASNGVPFRFDRFRVRGTLTNFIGLFEDETAQIDPRLRGVHRNQFPLNQQVIDFR